VNDVVEAIEKLEKRYECHCLKCNYKWTSMKDKMPIQCPRCNNKKWWMPKVKRQVEEQYIDRQTELKGEEVNEKKFKWHLD